MKTPVGRSGVLRFAMTRGFVLLLVGVIALPALDRAGLLNRRTINGHAIVLWKKMNGWKIIHLHASEVRLSITRYA
jgi:hypothetical protein